MHQPEKQDPKLDDSVRHGRSITARFLPRTTLAVVIAIAGFALPTDVFDGSSIAIPWLILRQLMITVGPTAALYYGCMAVIAHGAGGAASEGQSVTGQEPLEERIRQYVERIELDPSTAVSLTDIAPVPEWEAELRAGHGPRLIESFVRRTNELLTLRYPKALPFPFERLYRVGKQDGWWTAPGTVPYETAIAYFEELALSNRVTTAKGLSPTSDRGDQPVLLRAALTVTLAIFHSVQGHPAYRADH